MRMSQWVSRFEKSSCLKSLKIWHGRGYAAVLRHPKLSNYIEFADFHSEKVFLASRGDQHLASSSCLRNTDKPGYLCQLHFMWLGVLSQWLRLKSHQWAWNRREGKTGGRRVLTLWHRRGDPSVERCSLEFLPVTEADTGGQACHTLASGLHSQPATWRGGESISTYLF